MTDFHANDAVAAGLQCLQQIGALQHELEAAVEAISRNALQDFEHSLWQQEMLSSGLRRSLLHLSVLPADASLLARIHTALASLQQTSRVYQKLIVESGQSAAVLHDLCSLYQHTPVPVAAQTRQEALSCEA